MECHAVWINSGSVDKLPPLENITERLLVSDIAKTFDVLGWFSPLFVKQRSSYSNYGNKRSTRMTQYLNMFVMPDCSGDPSGIFSLKRASLVATF